MKRFIWIALVLLGIGTAAYWATIGCCRMMGMNSSQPSLVDDLGLTPEQNAAAAPLEKDFLARKNASCQILCEKRAQLIRVIQEKDPDQALIDRLVEEISTEQMTLEKATLTHLLALRKILEPAQQERLVARMSEQLRSACDMTACGMGGSCSMGKGRSGVIASKTKQSRL